MPTRQVVIDHVTLGVSDLQRSRSFYRRALEPLGFTEMRPWRDGAPGPRPEYSAGYYGAFVLDPDGNNIEAVHHG